MAFLLSAAFRSTVLAALTSVLCSSGTHAACQLARWAWDPARGDRWCGALTLLQSWSKAAVAKMSSVLRLRNTSRVLAGSNAVVDMEQHR